MSDKKKPATPETRQSLYENMGKTIDVFSPNLRRDIMLKKSLNKGRLSKEHEVFDAFLSLIIYCQYTNIESASVLRACFRANLIAEKRYNIKWINCQIIEAYKHLYGYGSKKKKSLWISKIKPALETINDPELIKDMEDMESHIVAFGKNGITDKGKRDLSYHYDLEPTFVYNMLIALSEEEEVQRLIKFMDLLGKISLFTSKYIRKYGIPTDVNQEPSTKYSFSLFEIDIFQEKKGMIFSSSETMIENQSRRLDEFMLHQRIPDKFIQHFKDIDKESMTPLHQLIEVEKIAIQLIFLYIDIASALRAYISSEYAIERQLSLKQVNTIIYEGFNKLYKLDSSSDNSFWNMYICPLMSETSNDAVLEEFDLLNKELIELKTNIKAYSNQRQLSVHLDRGISEAYFMLQEMNPFEESVKALLLLKFLSKLLTFLTKCLHLIGDNNNAIHEKKMTPIYEKIDNTIELLRKSPMTSQKEEAIRMLESFKSGGFLEEIIRRKRK
jgi:hypothetical protein